MAGQSAALIAYALEDALVNTLEAAITNGTLPTGTHIERVAPPERRRFPAVGVQFRSSTSTPAAQSRDDVVASYDIVIVTTTQNAPGVTGTGAATRAALRPLVANGAGTGIVDILNATATLGGLCSRSRVSHIEEMTFDKGGDAASGMVAALVVFECMFRSSF